MQTELTLNERAYYQQRKKPTLCKYGCGKNLVFLKTISGQTVACEAQMFKFKPHHTMSVMLKDGMTSS